MEKNKQYYEFTLSTQALDDDTMIRKWKEIYLNGKGEKGKYL